MSIYILLTHHTNHRLQTNNLGTALLAILLLPSMLKSSASSTFPRLVLVTSDLHYMADLHNEAKTDHILNTLNDRTYCTPKVIEQRYNVSKRTSSCRFWPYERDHAR